MTNTIYNDIGYLGSLRAEASSAPNKAINEVAIQFEALFVQQMMKSMRDAIPKSDLMQSDHLETYQSMADQQMAVNLSQHGGVGLARMLVEQMQTRGYVEESNSEGLAGTSSNESRRAASDIRTPNRDVTGGSDG